MLKAVKVVMANVVVAVVVQARVKAATAMVTAVIVVVAVLAQAPHAQVSPKAPVRKTPVVVTAAPSGAIAHRQATLVPVTAAPVGAVAIVSVAVQPTTTVQHHRTVQLVAVAVAAALQAHSAVRALSRLSLVRQHYAISARSPKN